MWIKRFTLLLPFKDNIFQKLYILHKYITNVNKLHKAKLPVTWEETIIPWDDVGLRSFFTICGPAINEINWIHSTIIGHEVNIKLNWPRKLSFQLQIKSKCLNSNLTSVGNIFDTCRYKSMINMQRTPVGHLRTRWHDGEMWKWSHFFSSFLFTACRTTVF